MVHLTSVVEVCQILELCFSACVSRLFLSMCETTTRSKSATHFRFIAAVTSPCAALLSPSILKNCRVALLGLGLGFGLEVGLVLVGLWFGLELQFRITTGRKSSSHIFLKNQKSITQHTSINKLSARHRYVLKHWAWQPLRYEGGKYDIKWSISSTTNTVCMFFTRNMRHIWCTGHWHDLTHICTVEEKL